MALTRHRSPELVGFNPLGPEDRDRVVGEPIVRKVPEGIIVDPEGTQLTYSAFGEHGFLPKWLKFDPENMTFWGTPHRPQYQRIYVKGTTQDGLSAHARTNVLITSDKVDGMAQWLIDMTCLGTPKAGNERGSSTTMGPDR
eukprot:Skav219317  [mRNA]  locus=scaffold1152:213977:219383:- [translate_table: standard]